MFFGKNEIELGNTLSDFTEILPLLNLCERSELVNISQQFLSFSQTRLLVEELSQAIQAKPKLE